MLQMLGTYRVEEKLADGGMGSVFLARAPDGRKVVLKVPLAQDRDAAIALADEARTGARLRHPAIVETLDFFVDAGRTVLVVAYVDGPTLFDLRRSGPLPASAVAEIGVQLASALHAIHTATDEVGRPLHMLHRDISPNNVLVDKEGQVRLIDLGIARSADRKQKATLAGMVKGTLRYLAPEILRGGDHSAASDIWALGLTLWEAAMARFAVAGDPMNTMRAAMDGSILTVGADEHIDRDLHEAIGALACNPEMRIQNARAAGAVLARLCARKPGGRAALAEAVAVVSAAGFEDERTDNIDVTLAGLRPPEEQRSSTAEIARDSSSGADVAGVFTTTTPRGQIAAATLAMPAGDPRAKVAAPPRSEESDVWSARSSSQTVRPEVAAPPARSAAASVMATAPTQLQMPASALPSETAEVAPTLLAMPRFASEDVSAEARTLIQMPAAQVAPVSAVGPTLVQMPAARAPVPLASQESDIETAATIQMPAWDASEKARLAREQPKPSLFLPIVVVDDDGEELP